MIERVYGSDGAAIPLDSLALTINRNVDGSTNYLEVVYNGVTYRQTFGYTSGNVTSISPWVAL